MTRRAQPDLAEILLTLGAGILTLRGAEPDEVAAVVADVSKGVKRALARIDDLNLQIVEAFVGGRAHGPFGECDCGEDDCPMNAAAANNPTQRPS